MKIFAKIAAIVPLAVVLALLTTASFGATSHLGASLISVAHADTGGAASAPDPSSGLGMMGYIALAVAVIGGLLRILDVVIGGMNWLAPRTKTTLDDKALKFAKAAHDRLDEIEKILARFVPADPAPVAKAPQAGFSTLGMLLAVAAAGALIACAAVKSEVKAIEAGVVACAKADKAKIQALGVQLGTAALVSLVTTGSIDWSALESQSESAAKTQGLEVAACAFGGLVADLQALFDSVHPTAPQALLAPVSPLDGSAEALASFQTANGITRIVQ